MFCQNQLRASHKQIFQSEDVALRRLEEYDAQAFLAHFHSLKSDHIRNRFNGVVSDYWLKGYIGRTLKQAIVIGAFLGAELAAVSELHVGGMMPDDHAEAAFSVASDFQNVGLGTIMMSEVLQVAFEENISVVVVTISSQNTAMKRLVRKIENKIQFVDGQVLCYINVLDALRVLGKPLKEACFDTQV